MFPTPPPPPPPLSPKQESNITQTQFGCQEDPKFEIKAQFVVEVFGCQEDERKQSLQFHESFQNSYNIKFH
jgi:hypothetical protein